MVFASSHKINALLDAAASEVQRWQGDLVVVVVIVVVLVFLVLVVAKTCENMGYTNCSITRAKNIKYPYKFEDL